MALASPSRSSGSTGFIQTGNNRSRQSKWCSVKAVNSCWHQGEANQALERIEISRVESFSASLILGVMTSPPRSYS